MWNPAKWKKSSCAKGNFRRNETLYYSNLHCLSGKLPRKIYENKWNKQFNFQDILIWLIMYNKAYCGSLNDTKDSVQESAKICESA